MNTNIDYKIRKYQAKLAFYSKLKYIEGGKVLGPEEERELQERQRREDERDRREDEEEERRERRGREDLQLKNTGTWWNNLIHNRWYLLGRDGQTWTTNSNNRQDTLVLATDGTKITNNNGELTITFDAEDHVEVKAHRRLMEERGSNLSKGNQAYAATDPYYQL